VPDNRPHSLGFGLTRSLQFPVVRAARPAYPFPRFPPLEAFGRRPQRKPNGHHGPSSETLHKTGPRVGLQPPCHMEAGAIGCCSLLSSASASLGGTLWYAHVARGMSTLQGRTIAGSPAQRELFMSRHVRAVRVIPFASSRRRWLRAALNQPVPQPPGQCMLPRRCPRLLFRTIRAAGVSRCAPIW